MSLSAALLPELDHEAATTRKFLERVPEDRFGWKPHEKSMTLGYLASHVAQLPIWLTNTIRRETLDIGPRDGKPYTIPTLESRAALVETFDSSVTEARQALAEASDEHLMGSWSLFYAGKQVFTMPRIAVIRSMVLSHLIHHRGQLSVYLRLNDVPVPATYGPSADERTF